MTIAEELDIFVDSITEIPVEKKYWLVRTQSGSLYDTFRENNFVALEHNEVPLSTLYDYKKTFGDDSVKILNSIKGIVKLSIDKSNFELEKESTPREIGLTASQIYKFYYEIKKGDVVIIPSSNSDIISFGLVLEDHIGAFTPEEDRKITIDAILKRRVKWIKDIKRIELDPYLHRMFTAHQALTNVANYAEIIERSLKDFFIIDHEAHLIINVQTEHEIPAGDLFGMGSEILRLVDAFAVAYDLDVSSKDLQVTVNLNSPGKIDLKSKIKKTTVITGLILAAFGGGYQSKGGDSFKTDGLSGLLSAIDKFMDSEQERGMKQQVFDKYKDSLDVKNPDDILKLLKQFSSNKDIPK